MTHYVSPDGHNILVKFDGEEIPLGFLRRKNFALYKFIRKELSGRFVVLPPSGAVAGVFVTVDHTRGVWKSTVNIALNGISEPVNRIDNQLYDMFSDSPETGKSINNIRFFENKGVQVLGSRTLSVQDSDTKYIPVRRFVMMVEASLKNSTSWVVFEPNEASTWSRICAIAEKYLEQKWQAGVLAGATPQAAFYVKCGIGETMTAQDLIEGNIRMEIGLALLRASEFTVFSLVHRQKAAAGTLQIA
jgi:phage tail sheath protein FI